MSFAIKTEDIQFLKVSLNEKGQANNNSFTVKIQAWIFNFFIF